MKNIITISLIFLTISIAYTQERSRTTKANNNRSARTVQNSSQRSSTQYAQKSTKQRTASTNSQHSTTKSSTTSRERVSPNRTTRTYGTANSSSRRPTSSAPTVRTRSTSSNHAHARHVPSDRVKVSSNSSTYVHSKHSKYSAHKHNSHKYSYHHNRYGHRNYRRSYAHIYVDFTPTRIRNFVHIYPHVDFSIYPTGYHIPTISAYKARYYKGEIATVYGRIRDMYYSPEYDEYYLYIGQHYPRHDLCLILPGNIARYYSRRPGWYFLNEEICVTGYISNYGGKPEMVVKRTSQFYIH